MLSPSAVSCSLTYCGGSLIQCKPVIKNNLLLLEKWGGQRVQNGVANKQPDYCSQNTIIAIHLRLLFCAFLLIGEAAGLCIEQFAFKDRYCIMAFQLPFPPGILFASHTLSMRQLVTPLSQMGTLWMSTCGDTLKVCTGPWGIAPLHLILKPTPLLQTCTQSSTVASLGGYWEAGALLQGGHV